MSLYLSPHSLAVADAVHVARRTGLPVNVTTVAEAVGSDVTNVVRACVEKDQFGAAAHVLSSYLEHDVCLAVSDYTRELIIAEAAAIDAKHGTTFAAQCRERVSVSYPAIDVGSYLDLDAAESASVLDARGLTADGYVLFLSRLAHAKGVDDLIAGFAASRGSDDLRLVIAGNGPDAAAPAGARRGVVGRRPDRVLRRRRRRREGAPHGGLRRVRAAEQAASGVRRDVRHRPGGEDARRRRTDHHRRTPAASARPSATARSSSRSSPPRRFAAALDRILAMSPDERAGWETRARLHALQFDRGAVLDAILDRVAARCGCRRRSAELQLAD